MSVSWDYIWFKMKYNEIVEIIVIMNYEFVEVVGQPKVYNFVFLKIKMYAIMGDF